MTEECAKVNESEPARARILQVAAQLFADDGYKGTSVRKICVAARVNVAMVNYYFHSKEELHLAAFDHARELARASAAEVAAASARAQLPPVEQLRLAILTSACTTAPCRCRVAQHRARL